MNTATCKKNCTEQYIRDLRLKRISRTEARRKRDQCFQRCEGKKEEEGKCKGGKLLHGGKLAKGDNEKCGEGFKAKTIQVAGGYLNKDKYETWCCPEGGEEGGGGCNGGYMPPQVRGKTGKYHALKNPPCRDGFTIKRGLTEDRKLWCCPAPEDACTSDDDCDGNKICKDGECVDPGDDDDDDKKECEGGHKMDNSFKGGKGRGKRPLTAEEREPNIPEDAGWFRSGEWQGHQIWNEEFGFQDLVAVQNYYKNGEDTSYLLRKGNNPVTHACEKGMERKTINGELWCCPADTGGGGGGTGEQFGWSNKLQSILDRLLGRAGDLLDTPRGLSEAERQAIANQAVQGAKRSQRGELQAMEDRMARMGLAGSGFQASQAEDIRRGTREDVANVRTRIAIQDAQDRYKQLLGTTGMAQDLTRTGMSAEQAVEAMNAARRGEGRQDMGLLLQYLSTIMGSGGGGNYWASILNSMNQGGGTPNNWLPWIGTLL